MIHKTCVAYSRNLYFVAVCLFFLFFVVPHCLRGAENTSEPPPLQEPFQAFYQDVQLDKVNLEGTIRTISTTPDPQRNDYDHCLYTILLEINSYSYEKKNASEKLPNEVVLVIPIMKDKKLIDDNRFKVGDFISVSCAAYDDMPEKVREIQCSDDVQSFEHEYYYAFSVKKIADFSNSGKKDFSKRIMTFLPIQTLPKDEKATKARRERIDSEMRRIENELKLHGGSFERWRKEYKVIADKYAKLVKDGFKGWIQDSYFAADADESIYYVYRTKEYIKGIKPYQEYLARHNIDLIVVRIPSKGDFAARVLASDTFRENPVWVEHYYECLKNDIEIIDPMPAMWENRFKYPLNYFYHVKSEVHPCEGAAFIPAEETAKVLSRYIPRKNEPTLSLRDTTLKTDQSRYFWPEGNLKYNPKENITFKQVVKTKDDKSVGDLSQNTGSPFLFLSNSFFYYPYRSLGASLPAYVGYLLQTIPDWYYQNGTGTAILKHLVMNQSVLNNRRCIIMVGSWGSFPTFPDYLNEDIHSMDLEKTVDLCSDELEIKNETPFMTKNDDHSVEFAQQKNLLEYAITLNIPAVEGKKKCMVRLNIQKSVYLTVSLLDSTDNSIIDPGINGNALSHVDLFTPVSQPSRKVKIKIRQTNWSTDTLASPANIKNIELWYY